MNTLYWSGAILMVFITVISLLTAIAKKNPQPGDTVGSFIAFLINVSITFLLFYAAMNLI